MKIRHGNLNALVESSAEERSFLLDYLSFEEARYVKGRFGAKRIAPKVQRMFEVISNSFPAGLVATVAKAAREAGFDVTLEDVRTLPFPLAEEDADVGWLYDYQRAAYDRVLERSRGILWMPTGSGKTEVACALGLAVQEPWLFIVHRKGLTGQAAQRFEQRTGEEAGMVGEGRWDVKRFTCATFQTLSRALKKRDPRAIDLLTRARGIIVDECHTLPAASFWTVAMRTTNAYYRVGLSGTPLARGDRKSLMAVAAIGPVIYRVRAQRLVDAGVLAKALIRIKKVDQESDKPTWQGVYGDCIVRSVKRNKAVVEAVQASTKPCLVFVKEIKHGVAVMKRLEKSGLRADFAHGKHSTGWRDNMIASLVRGDLDVLVTSVIMQEGTDIPSLESVVIASGGKSAIAALQRIGRGMRSDGGRKETFEVWDFNDTGHKWLERHTKERLRAYRSEGFDVEDV